MVGFTEAVGLFFRRYVDFRGRSTRAEYWWVQLFGIGVFVILASLLMIVDPNALDESADYTGAGMAVILLFVAFALALIIPLISLTVRRFHDIGLSGWWTLAAFVLSILPILGLLGSLAIFVVSVMPTKPALLKWGPPRHGRILPHSDDLPATEWTRRD